MAKIPDTIQPFQVTHSSNAYQLQLLIPFLLQFALFLTRLISHLSTDNEKIATCLQNIIKNCFVAYPRNTIWLMLGALDSDSPFVAKRMNTIFDLAKVKQYDHFKYLSNI